MPGIRTLSIALVLASGGCYEARETPQLEPAACSGCHGGQGGLAPPPGVWLRGEEATDFGRAHIVHLQGGAFGGPVPCDSCHRVPAKVTDPGHMDDALPAEVRFSARVARGGRSPSYDAQARRCSDTACHGLSGAAAPAPVWSGEQAVQCGDCHGLPPQQTSSGADHPASALTGCVMCHGKVVDAAGALLDNGLHINGAVEGSQ